MKDDTISRQAVIVLAEEIESKRLRGEINFTYPPMINGIKALPSAQKWIPCSERLPRAFETVNVTVQIPEGRYVKESALVNGIWGGINVYAKVVAWCPLPAPWEGEQNG